MSITVEMPNEKLAKAFLAAKPDNVDAKGVTVKVAKPDITRTKTNSRRVGVMSITKAENAQLGLLLKELYLSLKDNEERDQEDFIQLPVAIIRYPDAFGKLCSRYS